MVGLVSWEVVVIDAFVKDHILEKDVRMVSSNILFLYANKYVWWNIIKFSEQMYLYKLLIHKYLWLITSLRGLSFSFKIKSTNTKWIHKSLNCAKNYLRNLITLKILNVILLKQSNNRIISNRIIYYSKQGFTFIISC